MDKKTIAYILIGAGVIAAAYYLYSKAKGNAAAAALGAGSPDHRGAWAADDDALYKEFRGMFTMEELNWLDPLVEQAYNSGGCEDDVKIQGKASKAGSFACIIYGAGPNPKGTNPPWPWGGGQKTLWPYSKVETIWKKLAALRVKYGGL